MSLLPFFKWLESLALSTFIRESDWLSAAINVVHLLSTCGCWGAG